MQDRVAPKSKTDTGGSSSDKQVEVRQGSLHLGIGVRIFRAPKTKLTLGANFETGRFGIYTRETSSGNIDGLNWERLANTANHYGSIFLQCMIGSPDKTGLKIHLTPYYMFSFRRADITALHQAINSSWESVRTGNNLFGVKMTLAVLLVKK